jgi:hypothetical protein
MNIELQLDSLGFSGVRASFLAGFQQPMLEKISPRE